MSPPQIAIALAVFFTSALSCFFAKRVPDEMKDLEKPMRVIQALSGLTLLLMLSSIPWWLALVIAGALAIGWLPMAAAVGLMASMGSVALAAAAIPLGILAGARWVLDKREPLVYAVALAAFTLFFAGLKALGAF
jgi:hypothetical protein